MFFKIGKENIRGRRFIFSNIEEREGSIFFTVQGDIETIPLHFLQEVYDYFIGRIIHHFFGIEIINNNLLWIGFYWDPGEAPDKEKKQLLRKLLEGLKNYLKQTLNQL